jgi:hypothetical protein
VSRLCALYGVTRAGYYAWRARAESAHAERDRVLVKAIRRIFEASEGTYGSPRVQRELLGEGWKVSRRRVERLMRAAGLRGRVVCVYRSNPRLHQLYAQHPNRLWERRARKPDAIWVGDVTYLRVAKHWCYLLSSQPEARAWRSVIFGYPVAALAYVTDLIGGVVSEVFSIRGLLAMIVVLLFCILRMLERIAERPRGRGP